MSRSRSRIIVSALAVAAALAAPAVGAVKWPWTSGPEAGETVRFAGTVVGPAGEPLADVDVAVEGWRTGVDWRSAALKRAAHSRATVRSGPRGEFTIDILRDAAQKRFAVVAYAPYRDATGSITEYELARVDVTRRVRHGSPVTAVLAVEAPGLAFLRRLREFEAALRSEDERSTYSHLGLPEQVDRTKVGDSVEAAWWYYEQGRVCRFRDGRRIEVQTFPPIRRARGDREP
jgi:hypothetical protein